MNILLENGGLRPITEKEEEYFNSLYDCSSDEFMKKYSDEWTPDDLKDKYVVSIENNCKIGKKELWDKTKWNFNILGIYFTREDQRAELMYCGHIAFISVFNNKDELVSKLYKGDECYPENFNDWYENYIEENSEDDDINGKVPTKEDVIRCIELIIKAKYQNQDLELNIKEDNLIML